MKNKEELLNWLLAQPREISDDIYEAKCLALADFLFKDGIKKEEYFCDICNKPIISAMSGSIIKSWDGKTWLLDEGLLFAFSSIERMKNAHNRHYHTSYDKIYEFISNSNNKKTRGKIAKSFLINAGEQTNMQINLKEVEELFQLVEDLEVKCYPIPHLGTNFIVVSIYDEASKSHYRLRPVPTINDDGEKIYRWILSGENLDIKVLEEQMKIHNVFNGEKGMNKYE